SLLLTKNLLISNETKANQLHDYLLEHPRYATLIRAMDVNIRSPNEEAGFVELMSLAFTPTMESITGKVESERFFSKLTEIALNSGPATFRNLKFIPHSNSRHRLPYHTALLTFSNTMESVHLTPEDNPFKEWALMDQLASFNNLRKLYLDPAHFYLGAIDTILNSCPQVEELSINLLHGILSTAYFFQHDNTTQNSKVKVIHIYGGDFRDTTTIGYLKRKCPNADRFHIDTTKPRFPYNSEEHQVFTCTETILDIVYTVHDVLFYSLEFRLVDGTTVNLIRDSILQHGGDVLVWNISKPRNRRPFISHSSEYLMNEPIYSIQVSNQNRNN
ncbi:hypothetical protein MBANPS3_011825, partial [Mucor bainieri]